MPNWRKIVTSGSDASLNSLDIATDLSVGGVLNDNLSQSGTSGQILSSTGTGIEWIDSLAEGASDLVISGKNVTGTTIPKGMPLYFTASGVSGNVVGVMPADAGNPDRMPAGGVAGESLGAGVEGDVYIYGFINGVDTSAFGSGDDVYVAVGGGYTNVKPTGSALIQKLGNVEKVDATNGSGVIQGPSWFNDLPNWELGKVKVGVSDGQPVTSSVIHLDESNGRLGVGTNSPQYPIDFTPQSSGSYGEFANFGNGWNDGITFWDAEYYSGNPIQNIIFTDTSTLSIVNTKTYDIAGSSGNGKYSQLVNQAYIKKNVSNTEVTTAFVNLINSEASSSAGSIRGIFNQTQIYKGTNSSAFGLLNSSFVHDTGTVTTAYGLYNEMLVGRYGTAGGTISTGYANYNVINIDNSATVTTAYSSYNTTEGGLTGVTFTNYAAIVGDNPVAATNNTLLLLGTGTIPTGNYGIYNASSYSNYINGNVGIGTATPSHDLHILNSSTSGTQLALANDLSGGNKWVLSSNPAGGTFPASSFVISTGATAHFMIDGSSNVGIGKTPSTKLDVNGVITATGGTSTEWNAAYDDKINSATFSTSTGVVTLNQQDGGTVTVDLDGRYSTTDTTYTAGNGITLTGTVFSVAAGGGLTQDAGGLSHSDTSTQGSVNNSDGTVIQDVTLDTYGHVTALTSYNLDGRYYTETEVGNFFSGTTAITGYNKTNWDTAYGWGNHASVGYTDNVYADTMNQNVRTTDSPTFNRLTLSQTTGTAPLTVSSTTLVSNLNADLLDGQQGSYYAIRDHIRSLGTQAFTNGSNPNITTAQLVSEMESDGAFDSYTSVFKTSWSYAGNYNLTDAGRFTETAGTSWITWTDNSSDSTRGNITALAIAPNTGDSAGKVFIYNDQGSSYAPGWREVWTSTSDGAGSGLDADLWDGNQFASYLNQAVLTTSSPTFAGLNLGSGNLNTVENIYLDNAIFSQGDTNTYMQFHAADQWRVVTGGGERIEVNNSGLLVAGQISTGIGYTELYLMNQNVRTTDSVTFDRIEGESGLHVPVISKTAAYTLASGDEGGYIRVNSATAVNVTVPTNLSVSFPTGTVITISQSGIGQITAVGASGVTLNNNTKTAGQYTAIQLIKVGTDVWDVIGGIP